MKELSAMPPAFDPRNGIVLTEAQKRRRRVNNYLIAGAVTAFIIFVYVMTWIKIANKTFY
jgi:hypothetical protein